MPETRNQLGDIRGGYIGAGAGLAAGLVVAAIAVFMLGRMRRSL
jgi:acyl-coenzyme A thioesterase PaaI-like protein